MSSLTQSHQQAHKIKDAHEFYISTLIRNEEYSRLCIGKKGEIYLMKKFEKTLHIYDPVNSSITKIPLSGIPIRVIGDITYAKKRVIITDYASHCILSLNPKTGLISHLAGSRQGLSGDYDASFEICRFNKCDAIDYASNGLIYVADYGNNCIKEVNLKKRFVKKVAFIHRPFSCCSFDDNLIFASSAGKYIIACDKKTHLSKRFCGNGHYFGHLRDGFLNEASFIKAYYIAPTSNGDLYFSDTHFIRRINQKTGFVETICGQLNERESLDRKSIDGSIKNATTENFICLSMDKERDILYFIDGSNANGETGHLRRLLLPTSKSRDRVKKTLTKRMKKGMTLDLVDLITDFCYRPSCKCFVEKGKRRLSRCRLCRELPRLV